jgi:hypothetical protein
MEGISPSLWPEYPSLLHISIFSHPSDILYNSSVASSISSPYYCNHKCLWSTLKAYTPISTPYYAQSAGRLPPGRDYASSNPYISPVDHEDVFWKSVRNCFGANQSLQTFPMTKTADSTHQIPIQSTNDSTEPSDNAIIDADQLNFISSMDLPINSCTCTVFT